MGSLCCCLNGRESNVVQPDMESRRQQQVEAAERRRRENESRGIQDVDKVRRQQERAARLEREELEAAKQGHGQPGLRWQAD